MKSIRNKMRQAHFMIGEAGYDELSKMAKVQETSISNLLRRYAQEGVWRDKFLARGGEITYSKDGKMRRHRQPPF